LAKELQENRNSRVKVSKLTHQKGHPEDAPRCPKIQIKLSLSGLTLILHQSQCTGIADEQHDCHGSVRLARQTD